MKKAMLMVIGLWARTTSFTILTACGFTSSDEARIAAPSLIPETEVRNSL